MLGADPLLRILLRLSVASLSHLETSRFRNAGYLNFALSKFYTLLFSFQDSLLTLQSS